MNVIRQNMRTTRDHYPEGLREAVQAHVEDFSMSRKLAAWHEAGHAVVAALLGFGVRSVEIVEPAIVKNHPELPKLPWWGGLMRRKVPTGMDPGDPAFRLKDVCTLLAGHIAESLCDEPLPPNDRRAEFSPDMVEAAELIAAIAEVTDQEPEARLDQLLETTAALLQDHRDHLDALAERLFRVTHLRGGALQKLLPPPEPAEADDGWREAA